jgi:hypothetical protein
VVILPALFSNDRLDRRPQGVAIAGCARSDNREEKVASRHGVLHPKIANQYDQIG